ncbi:flagellar protein export ATPase FliI [Hydrogenovibrio marinus]|uniref:Flagellum-specific ATP synthase n=1 Tax=Hydrogenovibrio marinus TaxID=28885 RepID=A0A066ZYH0_HYDMR|nr:flagellar protein export ATPase FliI [Hydrogenovibrio marinus]KDN95401.1 flagellar protein FliI [Hydrogenovibrio marinus]BBN59890.1 flagellum-specific ATP synthase [Hydrogenovibrio marinus]
MLKQLFNQYLSHKTSELIEQIPEVSPLRVEGRLTRSVGMTLEVEGTYAPIGSRCQIQSQSHGDVEAEVVGFNGDRLFLMPIGDVQGLESGAKVTPIPGGIKVGVSEAMLGRVLDGAGKPLDGKSPVVCEDRVPLHGRKINPLERSPIEEPLDVGIKAINALLTIGKGQRVGLMAGTGVGKSVLLGMMTRYTEADIVVVGLIGERGREVNDFVRNNLGPEGLKRAVVIATPADVSPLMRMHGAMLATAIAEYFRDKGKKVLLLMDSLTRFAQAQREIALAVGEPPASKGYPPSVFAKLPQLVERAGNGFENGGSITAIYTVLAEGDDHVDPVVDSARGVLDGHILLSRDIADSGRYPAIDIESSISRLMIDIVPKEQVSVARRFKQIYSNYQKNIDLINVGAYRQGSDREIDLAIAKHPIFNQFLSQDIGEKYTIEESVQSLKAVVS